MQKISFSPASIQDREQIYNMLSDLENEKLNKKEFNKIYGVNIKNPNIYYLVASLNKQVVGFASLHIQNLLHHTGKIAEVQEIYVLPTIRGHGIGAKILDKLKAIAKRQGCKNFEVTCNMNRKDTHRFYIREGLQQSHYKFVQSFT